MKTLFHILTKQDWDRAQTMKAYNPLSLEREGFIHLSRPHQVLKTAHRFYSDYSEMILLFIDEEKIIEKIKYEKSDSDIFPHYYGQLDTKFIMNAFLFKKVDENWVLPEEFSLIGDTLIRPAFLGDEAEIASVHTHAWQESYPKLIPDEILAKRPQGFHSRMLWWREALKKNSSEMIFVAESSQHGIVAFCSAGPSRDKEFLGMGEITTIYCLNSYKKKGIGSALLNAGRKYLKMLKLNQHYLWVLEGNPTIKFYEKMGGKFYGQNKEINLGEPLKELAMVWLE